MVFSVTVAPGHIGLSAMGMDLGAEAKQLWLSLVQSQVIVDNIASVLV
jgi:hypothetical protein